MAQHRPTRAQARLLSALPCDLYQHQDKERITARVLLRVGLVRLALVELDAEPGEVGRVVTDADYWRGHVDTTLAAIRAAWIVRVLPARPPGVPKEVRRRQFDTAMDELLSLDKQPTSRLEARYTELSRRKPSGQAREFLIRWMRAELRNRIWQGFQ